MTKHLFLTLRRAIFVFALAVVGFPASYAADYQILGWNNLGMHCMDSDYSVFSILPPYNTIECQIVATNRLLTNGTGYTITYQAIADATGSSNSTSIGKGNFYVYDELLYGTNLPAEMGLAGWAMPGIGNTPQSMTFERTNSGTRVDWWRAEGIPITPYDNAGNKNPYPMMRLIAKRGATFIATNDIVLPVSDEMDCRVCHASGTQNAAQPGAGWVWSANPERDYRLNILRLHDEKNFADHHDVYVSALAARPGNGRQFNPQGLYRSVVADSQPVLCAACHASEALGSGSYSNIPPLTASVHSKHTNVLDPDLLITLDNSANRAACYRCHPGSTTKCLRGAMGASVSTNGVLAMQCQSCHGNMSAVGASNRHGWLDEPDCQSCHVGNATANGGRRYTSVFTNNTVRLPVDLTFATDTNTPPSTNNYSLYRFSNGHGNLQCSACHGSTHAEFPSSHANDNIRNIRIQEHVGMVSECSSCHNDGRNVGGPHGMHEAGDGWADPGGHGSAADSSCNNCHGSDERGTELSETKSANTFTTSYGTKGGYRGYRVGCYTCHNGSGSPGSVTTRSPATSPAVTTNTASGTPVTFKLPVTDGNSPTQLTNKSFLVRVISQPANGTVGIRTNGSATNWVATYIPDPGFVGTNTFTFAAWNTYVDSDLCTGTVVVTQGVFSISAKTLVPPSYPATWSAPFTVLPTLSNVVGTVTFDWDFGDASPHSTNQYATHTYASANNYPWSVVSRLLTNGVSARTTTNSGTVVVGPPVSLVATRAGSSVVVSWPQTAADALLEQSPLVGSGANWAVCTNVVTSGGGTLSVTVPNAGMQFYRLRKL